MTVPHLTQEGSFRPQVRESIGDLSSQDEVKVTLNPMGGYSGAIEITIANAGEDHFDANIDLSDSTRFPARIRAIATELRAQGFVGRFLISHHDGEVAIARQSDLAQFSAPNLMALRLKESIRRICQLQPLYSPENSVAMQERGRLIRRDLAEAIESRGALLKDALGQFGDDFHLDASDGVGRKTELPWVRFCSKSMSPSPREGFYCVIHFSTDGSAVHFTVSCSSSRYSNGSFSALPDKELLERTAWARKVILEEHGTLAPFSDEPNFGAKRPLTKSFEKAIAISKRVGVDELDSTDIDSLLSRSATLLASIYRAELDGRDLSPADQDELALIEIARPLTKKSGQGFGGLSAADRKRVELRVVVQFED